MCVYMRKFNPDFYLIFTFLEKRNCAGDVFIAAESMYSVNIFTCQRERKRLDDDKYDAKLKCFIIDAQNTMSFICRGVKFHESHPSFPLETDRLKGCFR